jgi:hypothetical protein
VVWFRKERQHYVPPEPPPVEDQEAAQHQLNGAREALAAAEDRDEEVRERGEVLDSIHQVNHLGPAFWTAVGLQRKRAR